MTRTHDQSALDELLTTADVAGRLGVPPRTLEQWRYLGRGPAYIKVGNKSVRYRQSDIDAFLDDHRVVPAGGGGDHAPAT